MTCFIFRNFYTPKLNRISRKSGEKLFDYVDPKNRQVQIEMEQACTAHLKDTGAWLEPRFRKIHFDEGILNMKHPLSYR